MKVQGDERTEKLYRNKTNACMWKFVCKNPRPSKKWTDRLCILDWKKNEISLLKQSLFDPLFFISVSEIGWQTTLVPPDDLLVFYIRLWLNTMHSDTLWLHSFTACSRSNIWPNPSVKRWYTVVLTQLNSTWSNFSQQNLQVNSKCYCTILTSYYWKLLCKPRERVSTI